MNLVASLALYATITKELGEELMYPGSQGSYFGETYATLITKQLF